MNGMAVFFVGIAGFLLATLVVGLWRVLRGPDAADRLMAAQLFGTTATGILLLLAEATGEPALRYVALVFASLAIVTVIAFVRLAWPGGDEAESD